VAQKASQDKFAQKVCFLEEFGKGYIKSWNPNSRNNYLPVCNKSWDKKKKKIK
jgi:hypothetical protein